MKIKCSSKYPDYLIINESYNKNPDNPILIFEMVDEISGYSQTTVHIDRDKAREIAAALNRFADGGSIEESK